MKRILKDYSAEKYAKADRSWLPVRKMYNSFSHPPKKSDHEQSDIFSKGQLNSHIDRGKFVL